MIPYDPNQPLVSLHVPKCAGQALRHVLGGWFGQKLLLHYKNAAAPPTVQPWRAGTCIHGHFNSSLGFGVELRYPQATQLIAVVRDPLEMAVSNYFFWKRKARALQIAQGRLQPGSEHDYRDIDDFFRKRPRSVMLNFLPTGMAGDAGRSFVQSHFVSIGTVENLPGLILRLAKSLGFPPATVPRVNESPRDETLAPALARRFRDANRQEQDLYRYVRSLEGESPVRSW